MSYIKETDLDKQGEGAVAVHHDIKPACFGGDENGENILADGVSKTPSNSFEKDTSLNKRTKKELEKKIEEESQETQSKTDTPPRMVTRRRKRRTNTKYEEVGISYEEEKMLSLAIKNSMREQKASTAMDYSKVKKMVEYHPTEEEFKDPVKYIETLFYEGAWKLGCIKIIPPASFKPNFSFEPENGKKMPTRYQTLQHLSQGKVRKDVYEISNSEGA